MTLTGGTYYEGQPIPVQRYSGTNKPGPKISAYNFAARPETSIEPAPRDLFVKVALRGGASNRGPNSPRLVIRLSGLQREQ